jgi:tripartite-type tricarboxylate transporter receptor subunit TctC
MQRLIQLILALFSLAALQAAAQNYPARSINLIVPFAAGGPSDALARVIGQAMSATLGQQIAIDQRHRRRRHAGRSKGSASPSRWLYAAPRAHRAIGERHALSQTTVRPGWRVRHHRLIAEVPMVIVGRKDLPPKDIGELIAYIKANKDKVTYGNGGVGSASHFCGLLFMSAMQAEMTTVSYRGSAPAMLDVLGGRLDLLCDQTTTTTSHMKAATIKAMRSL